MDWVIRIRITGWFDAYYQPEKLRKREFDSPGFRDRYLLSLFQSFADTGKCSISSFDSTTGTQLNFSDDPNNIL